MYDAMQRQRRKEGKEKKDGKGVGWNVHRTDVQKSGTTRNRRDGQNHLGLAAHRSLRYCCIVAFTHAQSPRLGIRCDRIHASGAAGPHHLVLGTGRCHPRQARLFEPGGSKKDRVARGIIDEAERLGTLKPGQPVVELTSGNTGTGLAIVCGVKGHPFIAVMSRGNSRERARMMRALGAEVVLVDQLPESIPGQVSGGDLALVDAKAREIELTRGAFRADQFTRDGNWIAHFEGTGTELWEQTDGHLDGFVDFVGSGGTYAGVTKKLKAVKPEIKCFVVEPEGAAVLAGQSLTRPEHPIQGEDTLWNTSSTSETCPWTDTSKSQATKHAKAPASWLARRASSGVSPAAQTSWPLSACSEAR
ncbi:hypothetical protein EHS25_007759 [Saitozyma podzolica]|uniref:Tryptophan synthase beta chain-like PALP domain-containing protein n=1 Tax=Saitozyma podzolica TaxID=1890683 RepID=A0A427YQM8_9TREE|nr:hypothetical protein EHS25_007759 [Saitozyma podzolica]